MTRPPNPQKQTQHETNALAARRCTRPARSGGGQINSDVHTSCWLVTAKMNRSKKSLLS